MSVSQVIAAGDLCLSSIGLLAAGLGVRTTIPASSSQPDTRRLSERSDDHELLQ